jgi:lysophospholipase L1-like esterase
VGPGHLPPQPRLALRHWAFGCAATSLAALLLAQGQRLLRARAWLRQAPPPFERCGPAAQRRILLVGDSTGAGVGCERADDSIAAALARDFPQASVENRCAVGARVADVLETVRALPAGRRWDLVLVFAGGNDVLRFTRTAALCRQARALLRELARRSDHVVWAGMANVGLAPLFLPPWSWLLSRRTRRVSRLLAGCAADGGVEFVDFYRERGADLFSVQPQRYYARDRVHPSAAAYAWCYARMRSSISGALRPRAARSP